MAVRRLAFPRLRQAAKNGGMSRHITTARACKSAHGDFPVYAAKVSFFTKWVSSRA
jgi:hypothetical protein